MGSFQAALTNHRGLTFAVINVKPHIVDSPFETERTILGCRSLFPGVPIVLAGVRGHNVRYRGDSHAVQALRGVDLVSLPWKTWSSPAI